MKINNLIEVNYFNNKNLISSTFSSTKNKLAQMSGFLYNCKKLTINARRSRSKNSIRLF